jgi:hypothetical protein
MAKGETYEQSKDPHYFRLCVIVQATDQLRAAIERNHNVYSGALIPNLQTITDVCVLPLESLIDEVKKWDAVHARLYPIFKGTFLK